MSTQTEGKYPPGDALVWRIGERIADEVEKVAAKRQSDCEQAARDVLAMTGRDELLEVLTLILPLAKGYAPDGQTSTAKATCRSWIEAAEVAIAKAEGRSNG